MMYILLLYPLLYPSQCWLPSVSQGNAPLKQGVQYYIRLISPAAALQEPPPKVCRTKIYEWGMLLWKSLLGWISWCLICKSSHCRDYFVYAPKQWETTLQCNIISHWLGAYTKRSIPLQVIWRLRCVAMNWYWPESTRILVPIFTTRQHALLCRNIQWKYPQTISASNVLPADSEHSSRDVLCNWWCSLHITLSAWNSPNDNKTGNNSVVWLTIV